VSDAQRRPGVLLRVVRLTLLLGVVMLALRVGGCAERLFYVPTREPTPVPREFDGARLVRFESRDGTKLCGWFIPAQRGVSDPNVHDAATARTDRAPTVLHVHGNAGNMNGHIGFTEYLPYEGFNLFLFDYRGYGESEGTASRRGPLTEDASAALDAMLAQPEVDPSRAALFGQSLGGAIAVNLMAQRDEFRCAVLESPFASWRLAAATALSGGEPGWVSRSLAWLLIDDANRPVDSITSIDVPILIVHGDADRIVPVLHGRLLRDAAPERVTLIEFKGGDHNTLCDTHPESRRMSVEFLRKHLGVTAAK